MTIHFQNITSQIFSAKLKSSENFKEEMEEKENSSLALNDEIIASSQGSEINTSGNTQRLHLELEDETEKLALGKLI